MRILLFVYLFVQVVESSPLACLKIRRSIHHSFIDDGREWRLGEDYERALQEISSSEDFYQNEDKIKLFTKLLLEGRLQSASLNSQKSLQKILNNFFKENSEVQKLIKSQEKLSKSEYSNNISRSLLQKSKNEVLETVSYDPIKNQIRHPFSEEELTVEKIFSGLIHEAGHADDYQRRKLSAILLGLLSKIDSTIIIPTPLKPYLKYLREKPSIGAQWELAQRIPKDTREKLIQKLKEAHREKYREKLLQLSQMKQISEEQRKGLINDEMINAVMKVSPQKMSDDLFEIAIASLEKAHLSKEEFISEMQSIHGYDLKTLLKNHYNPKQVLKDKSLVISLVATQALFIYLSSSDPNFIIGWDINFIMDFFSALIPTNKEK